MNGHLAAAAAILLAGWLLLTLVRPVIRCPRCQGKRVMPAGNGFAPCTRCRGTGRARRRGAALIHRFAREHLWPRLRDRIRPELPDERNPR